MGTRLAACKIDLALVSQRVRLDGKITVRKEPNGINEELVCIDSFVQYLRQNIGLKDILVEPEEDDPPDFWVTIENMKYAVEVTSIVSNYGYEALCRGFEEEIESEAKHRYVL